MLETKYKPKCKILLKIVHVLCAYTFYGFDSYFLVGHTVFEQWLQKVKLSDYKIQNFDICVLCSVIYHYVM